MNIAYRAEADSVRISARHIVYTLLGIFLCIANVEAQVIKPAEYNEHDLELWTGIGINHKINKKWYVSLSQSYRTNSNASLFKNAFTQFDLEYRRTKNIRFSGAIRYIYRGPQRHSIRPLLNFAYVHRLDKVNIKNRLRYQQDFEGLESSEALVPYLDFYLRNKLTVTFKKVEKIEPRLYAEIFYHMHYKNREFDQLRLGVGFATELTKRQELSLAYTYREEFNVSSPLQSNVISVSLNFELKKLPRFKTSYH